MRLILLLSYILVLVTISEAWAADYLLSGDSDYKKAIELRDSNKIDKSLNKFDAAILRHPGSAEAYYARGVAWNWKGNHAMAIADFRKAAELDPQNASYTIQADDLELADAEILLIEALKYHIANDQQRERKFYSKAMKGVHLEAQREKLRLYYKRNLGLLRLHQGMTPVDTLALPSNGPSPN
jgi:tetratricopeptide (TPR) repeat protein